MEDPPKTANRETETPEASAIESEAAVETEAAVEPVADQPVADEPVVASPEERIAALEEELAEAKDRLLRALAETENVRRRAERDREDTAKYAVSGFARSLLDVADNLRRALDAVPEDAKADGSPISLLIDGVAATERQLASAFERAGIARIEPDGERFDPNFHQAMFEVPGSGKPAGTVVQVIQSGYTLNGRLLRPALVGVARDAPAAD